MTRALGLDPRHDHEAQHFDRVYDAEAARGLAPLSQADRQRYTAPEANTIFPREYFYHLLAPLAGKRTLEIACGNGIDASICAHNGALVHAYDLSPRAVALTRHRAQINGVADRMRLEVGGDLSTAFAGEAFDAVLGYAVLHHLPLAGLAETIHARLKPGGVAVFAEPVINSRALAAIRRCIPLRLADMTEDETPLNDRVIADLARPFARTVRREFQCVSRIWPFFPNCWSLAVALHQVDACLMKLPFLRRFASVVVFAMYRGR